MGLAGRQSNSVSRLLWGSPVPPCHWAIFCGLCCCSGDGPAAAADARKGETLAKRWCATCHVVAADQQVGTTQSPAFSTIAHNPEFNEAMLALFLLNPHPRMPDMNLSRSEAADLAAYAQNAEVTRLKASCVERLIKRYHFGARGRRNCRAGMSAIGTKRTRASASHMSAFGGKARGIVRIYAQCPANSANLVLTTALKAGAEHFRGKTISTFPARFVRKRSYCSQPVWSRSSQYLAKRQDAT